MSLDKAIVNPAESRWEKLAQRPSSRSAATEKIVRKIIARVRRDGDAALYGLAEEIDGMRPDCLEVSGQEFLEASSAVAPEVKAAIADAILHIRRFHEAQMPAAVRVRTEAGVDCRQKPVPIEKVGLYIPGGTAPLFSTVLMLAVPAAVAGCREVILCTPASRKTGKVASEVLYAAAQCGVTRVFKVGGAQAIAAMAFGTESIPRVWKIFGPGNRFVTTAKQMLGSSKVAIDMPAGPSEVMVVADRSSNPAFVAADLLSQAEHGADSQVVLVCDSRGFHKAVCAEVAAQTAVLDRGRFIEMTLANSRAVIFDGEDSRERMMAFANCYAPEHLIIAAGDPEELAEKVTDAGSVFIGPWSPESAGDYASGTNHTLPTSAWAHSYSGVNIDSFMKKITFQKLDRKGLGRLSGTIVSMAEAEGLQAHANAVKIRMDK